MGFGDNVCVLCFFQAEDGIRDLVRSRGLGDVYKRQRLRALQGHRPLQGLAGAAGQGRRRAGRRGGAVRGLSLIHI